MRACPFCTRGRFHSLAATDSSKIWLCLSGYVCSLNPFQQALWRRCCARLHGNRGPPPYSLSQPTDVGDGRREEIFIQDYEKSFEDQAQSKDSLLHSRRLLPGVRARKPGPAEMGGDGPALTEIFKSGFSQARTGAPQTQREGVVETEENIYFLIISQHLELQIRSRITLLDREGFSEALHLESREFGDKDS